MRERLVQASAILLLAILAAGSAWYARVLRQPTVTAVATPGLPDFTARQVVFTQFDANGQARFRLAAESMRHFVEDDRVELQAPRLVSLDPTRPQVQAQARSGRVDNLGERVHLDGEVRLSRAGDGRVPPLRLATEYLLALPDQDRYQTDRPVRIERGGSTIEARGMLLDNIARTAEFAGRGRQLMAPPPAGPR